MANNMKVTHWKKALENAVLDPAVGIRIAPLTDNTSFGMYVTEILPGKKISAHYHQEGGEVYEIIRGNGMLYTAPAESQSHHTATTVTAGDFFNIDPNVVHQLVNTGDEPLILIFGCPGTHLGLDRVVVSDFECA
jgi:mannose-6-phosphate isomerase-like protein (cupin superfamily)